MATAAATGIHLHDLPEPILTHIFSLVCDVRSRNAMSLACRRWRTLERATRSSLVLRGHVRSPFLLPTCFPAVAHLDLSLLSPWGHHPFLLHHQQPPPQPPPPPQYYHENLAEQAALVAARLAQTFPCVSSLAIYARDPSVVAALAPRWPGLRAVRFVRWHQRPPALPLGADLAPLLAACPALSTLDLSQFYCWTEDVPQALQDHPVAAASLTRLDLLCPASTEGFCSSKLADIAAACPNLTHLLVPCVFNPRCIEFVGDDALLMLAAGCPRLSLLHLVDPSTLSPARSDSEANEDAAVTGPGLEELFAKLPQLEDLALDLCHNVRDAGPSLEMLSYKCPKIKSLKLGQFHGVCKGGWLHLDGVSVCGRLESLCIKNSADLIDASLVTIARGCRRLSRLEIHGCHKVTEAGLKKLSSILRSTLVDVAISGCQLLDAARSLRALEPIRDRIARLHIDCIWVLPELDQLPQTPETTADDSDVDQVDEEMSDESRTKKSRYSDGNDGSDESSSFWFRTWASLRCLSLWVPAGEVLTPLGDAGLESCPQLEGISIKVEGDCRTCPRPRQGVFGLSFLARYPRLVKMKLDCGEAIGYALTAPTGHMDLSLWERFYLHGISDLRLYELDYWPPQDREVNQRSLSLPATGLIQECLSLRKLFIHGTTHEHFLRFFLMMPVLRDVQLREDYYPAPENDMSTEMRVDSCGRFEEALNTRLIPD
ncbi:LRR [Musa troglodytarum]|uniref:LRR n=1 Tax=Musa troglodytarum TaxID=320322 RepID=A0A9E7JV88_9LILI|nr:LRR [Musa troglodytarum]